MYGIDRRTRFVSCSATISQPKQHMQNIFGVDVCRITLLSGLILILPVGHRGDHRRLCTIRMQELSRLESAAGRGVGARTGQSELHVRSNRTDAFPYEERGSSNIVLQGTCF